VQWISKQLQKEAVASGADAATTAAMAAAATTDTTAMLVLPPMLSMLKQWKQQRQNQRRDLSGAVTEEECSTDNNVCMNNIYFNHNKWGSLGWSIPIVLPQQHAIDVTHLFSPADDTQAHRLLLR